jgi:hypothetical protein
VKQSQQQNLTYEERTELDPLLNSRLTACPFHIHRPVSTIAGTKMKRVLKA